MRLVFTDPWLTAAAYEAIDELTHIRSRCRAYTMLLKSGWRMLRVEGVRSLYEQYASNVCRIKQQLTNNAHRFVEMLTDKYMYARIVYDSPISSLTVLAITALPPDVTLAVDGGPLINPGSYINVSFVVTRIGGRKHANKVAKFVMESNFEMLYKYTSKMLERTPRLLEFFERKYREYMDRGKSRAAARTIAVKDVIRVVVGAAWLTAMLEMLEEEVISPQNIVLPYELATSADPLERAKTMIQPIDVSVSGKDTWRDYNWLKLVKIVKNK